MLRVRLQPCPVKPGIAWRCLEGRMSLINPDTRTLGASGRRVGLGVYILFARGQEWVTGLRNVERSRGPRDARSCSPFPGKLPALERSNPSLGVLEIS